MLVHVIFVFEQTKVVQVELHNGVHYTQLTTIVI